MDHDLVDDISTGRSMRQGTLAGRHSAIRSTHPNEVVAHMVRDPRQALVIVQALGKPFGFAEDGEHLLRFSEGMERIAQVEPELGVVGFLALPVLILGAVVDQQEQAGGGQALNQAIQERLGLRIDPLEVLEDREERLHLALPQEQAFEGVQGALAARYGGV
jgi:hypothetical protein